MSPIKTIIFMSVCLASSAFADSELMRDSAKYVIASPYASGAATIKSATGGIYVYSRSPDTPHPRGQRYLFGKVPPQSYEFFSAQEEAALDRMRSSQLAAIAETHKAARHKRMKRKSPKFDWPKVVLEGKKTCVPNLEFANSSDWAGHLICWNPDTSHVE